MSGRPNKQGLDFFFVDVGFFQDIKVRKIAKACGPNSYGVLLCLLCNIYRDRGYYMAWDGDDPFLIADEVGVTEGYVEEVVRKSVQVGFFDQEKFSSESVLTSEAIQRRFFNAANRRKEVTKDGRFLINADINRINVYNNSINADTNAGNRNSKSNRDIFSLSYGDSNAGARVESGEREPERERESFYKIFFFRNAGNPEAETAKFINYYSATDWKRNGEPITDKIALAKMWKITEGGRFPEKFLTMWESFYARLWTKDGDSEGTRSMITDIYAVSVRENAVTLAVSPELQGYIEQSLDILRPLWRQNYRGYNLQYITKN